MTRTILTLALAFFSSAALAGSASLSSAGESLSASADSRNNQAECRAAYDDGVRSCRLTYAEGSDDLAVCLEGVKIGYFECMRAASSAVAELSMSSEGAEIEMADWTGTADSADVYAKSKDGSERFIGTADVGQDGEIRVRIEKIDAIRIRPDSRIVVVLFQRDEIVSEREVRVRR